MRSRTKFSLLGSPWNGEPGLSARNHAKICPESAHCGLMLVLYLIASKGWPLRSCLHSLSRITRVSGATFVLCLFDVADALQTNTNQAHGKPTLRAPHVVSMLGRKLLTPYYFLCSSSRLKVGRAPQERARKLMCHGGCMRQRTRVA